MMSIPLASTWVRLLPSCGRARATIRSARLRRSSARRNLPAARGAGLSRARAASLVDEKVNAAAGPRLSAQIGQQRNAPGEAGAATDARKSVPSCAGNQSGRFKLPSLHKPRRFLEEQPAVLGRRVVARELDQVAAIQEILEQRLLVVGKGRGFARARREIRPRSAASRAVDTARSHSAAECRKRGC